MSRHTFVVFQSRNDDKRIYVDVSRMHALEPTPDGGSILFIESHAIGVTAPPEVVFDNMDAAFKKQQDNSFDLELEWRRRFMEAVESTGENPA